MPTARQNWENTLTKTFISLWNFFLQFLQNLTINLNKISPKFGFQRYAVRFKLGVNLATVYFVSLGSRGQHSLIYLWLFPLKNSFWIFLTISWFDSCLGMRTECMLLRNYYSATSPQQSKPAKDESRMQNASFLEINFYFLAKFLFSLSQIS